MNWKKEAENDLKAHEKRKAALRSLAEEIRELQARTYGSTAPAADAVPVQGGTSTAEGRLIAAIDELERKKGAYRATKRKVDAVERGLATLTAQQVDILDSFFIHRTREMCIRDRKRAGPGAGPRAGAGSRGISPPCWRGTPMPSSASTSPEEIWDIRHSP